MKKPFIGNDTFDEFRCGSCGRIHRAYLKELYIDDDAIQSLPEVLKRYNSKKPYILSDDNTFCAGDAGKKVLSVLDRGSFAYSNHIMKSAPGERLKPDERTVGNALMYLPADADSVISIGSGVLNDTGKIIAATKGVPYIIIATAPSMDGFASANSSMERDGLKVSIDSKCPDVVIADLSVLISAPAHMILSGTGDMLAKYVSIAEWKISNIITGDYYCQFIADTVSNSLNTVVKNATGALSGNKEAISKILEGLVFSGICMNYAGNSRPVSGMEHYISHIFDMRALEFGTASDLHGIQCGIATLKTIEAYEKLTKYNPDIDKALKYVEHFDYSDWSLELKKFLGRAADVLIEKEKTENKYSRSSHRERIMRICEEWDKIKDVISTLPSSSWLRSFMKEIGHPVSFSEIGISSTEERKAFIMAKDIRDKYVLGKLLWDLGILDEF